MLKPSTATANAALDGTGLKEQFDGGTLFVFAGPVPANADEVLDMAAKHTLLLAITDCYFNTPALGVISKDSSTWEATVDIDGFEDTETSLTPTFYRFCAGGDNGQGAANPSTGFRVQGTAGGPNSGSDLQFGTAQLTDGNTQPVGAFSWALMK